MSEHILGRRITRRDFLKSSGMAAAALALTQTSHAKTGAAPVRIGSGYFTYELVDGWGELPSDMTYGFGCGIAVDSKDRIYVLTRTKPGLIIFDRSGNWLEAWEEEPAVQRGISAETFTKSAHGLYWAKEGRNEVLFFTENKPGCRITKTDLHGNVLLRIGNVPEQSPASIQFKFDNPTDVAVAANGDIYVVDGYGSQLVHRFSKDGQLIRTIGGRGADHGKFDICHGVWISTLNKEPEVCIADRKNGRVEIFSLALDYKRTIGDLRLPCCFYQHKNHLFVPDLASRVTVIDAKDQCVAHLGDGKEIEGKDKPANVFIAPHALTLDSRGDLYVLEWVPYGRLRKFKHTPQKA